MLSDRLRISCWKLPVAGRCHSVYADTPRSLTMIQRIPILLTLVFASIVFAQPMVERVPSDAVVYVGWQGADSLNGYENSHLKGVIDSSSLPQLVSEFLPRVIERIGKQDAQAAAVFRSSYGVGQIFIGKPCALYFGGIELGGAGPMPKLTLIADGGGDAQKMLDSLAPLVESLNRAGAPLVASLHGKRFVTLSVGADISGAFAGLLGDAADKTLPPLSGQKEFADAIKQVQKQPVVAFYIDAEAALKLVDQIAAGEGAQMQQHIANVRDAMGLGGIKRIVCAGGFESSNWATQCFIGAPSPRNGLLAMLDGKPLGDEILKVVPKSANYVAAWRFDVAKAFTAVHALVGDLDPDS